MGPAFTRLYATLLVTGTTAIKIPIVKRGSVDFAIGTDWTPANGDVKISKDGGAAANVTNLPTAVTMGNTAYWEFILTATELTCKCAVITVADAATKAVEDTQFNVETFGNSSAMYQWDMSAANLPANLVQILGTTLTETVGGYLKAAFVKLFDVASPVLTSASVNQTGDNYAKITDANYGLAQLVRSNTPANKLNIGSDGVVESNLKQILSAALSGTGSVISAAFCYFFGVSSPTGTVNSLPSAVPGSSGGVLIAGSNAATTFATLTVTGALTINDGLFVNRSTAGSAVILIGNGTGHGLHCKSGSGATGNGVQFEALSTDGNGMVAVGTGSGNGCYSYSAGTGNGIKVQGGNTSGAALYLVTTSGAGIQVRPTAGHGIDVLANGSSKHGILVQGGTGGTSDGINVVAGTGGVQVRAGITGDITGNLSGTVSIVTTLTNAPSDSSGVTTLLSRLTSTRAAYLDNLSGGAVALASGVIVTTNNDKTGYALTSGERVAIAAAVEYAIVDETDNTHVMQAIIDKIAAANPSLSGLTLSAIAAQIRTELAPELALIDAAISTRAAQATALSNVTWTDERAEKLDYLTGDSYSVLTDGDHGNSALKTALDAVAERTDNLPDQPAAAGDQMALTDAAENALVTELTNDLTSQHGAGSWQTADISEIESILERLNTGLTDQRMENLDNCDSPVSDCVQTGTTVDANVVECLGDAVTVSIPGVLNVNVSRMGDSDTAPLKLANAAANMAARYYYMKGGNVDSSTFTPTTTVFETNITANVDYFTGRTLRFHDVPSGNLAGVPVVITGYAFSHGKVKLTITPALPAAPANGATFHVEEIALYEMLNSVEQVTSRLETELTNTRIENLDNLDFQVSEVSRFNAVEDLVSVQDLSDEAVMSIWGVAKSTAISIVGSMGEFLGGLTGGGGGGDGGGFMARNRGGRNMMPQKVDIVRITATNNDGVMGRTGETVSTNVRCRIEEGTGGMVTKNDGQQLEYNAMGFFPYGTDIRPRGASTDQDQVILKSVTPNVTFMVVLAVDEAGTGDHLVVYLKRLASGGG